MKENNHFELIARMTHEEASIETLEDIRQDMAGFALFTDMIMKGDNDEI